jgi:hypothetical protein
VDAAIAALKDLKTDLESKQKVSFTDPLPEQASGEYFSLVLFNKF